MLWVQIWGYFSDPLYIFVNPSAPDCHWLVLHPSFSWEKSEEEEEEEQEEEEWKEWDEGV